MWAFLDDHLDVTRFLVGGTFLGPLAMYGARGTVWPLVVMTVVWVSIVVAFIAKVRSNRRRYGRWHPDT